MHKYSKLTTEQLNWNYQFRVTAYVLSEVTRGLSATSLTWTKVFVSFYFNDISVSVKWGNRKNHLKKLLFEHYNILWTKQSLQEGYYL